MSVICFVSSALSKYIIPVTSLPKIIPIAKAIKISGIFQCLKKDAIKTINAIINPLKRKIDKCIINILKINIKAWQI